MKVKVLDTTLRDGEQTPGVSLNSMEKFRIASKLDEIGLDFIEAGSAITSEGERESIKNITSQGFNAEILSFSRPLTVDIDYCLECDVDAVNLVVPTSDLHVFDKLKITKDELVEMSNSAVDYCKDHGLTVELSAEDASRSNLDFLKNVFLNAIDHGADRICVCDTVGILTPYSSFELFNSLRDINAPGIGERAGNTSFEESIVSIDRLLPDFSTDIKINEIYDLSKLVARLTGVYIQPNKAIVGENAFAHESGIHSDGIIKNSATYEPMTPELVGRSRRFIIGKHMGTHGLNSRLNELGLNVDKVQLQHICDNIKELADKGKTVTDVDLQAIAENVLDINYEDRIKLEDVTVVSGKKVMPTASVKLNIDGEEILNAGVGIGPVDAAINAINSLEMFDDIDFIEYHVDAITGGTDALIDVIIKLQKGDRIISARGTEPDIIDASVKAYISGVNRLLQE